MRTSLPKVAVIGAGRWGQNIVRTLHALGALVAVAEQAPALLAQLKANPDYKDITFYADYVPILNDTDIQAVCIATPVATHFSVAQEALEAGKDVFVEKPMTMTVDEAEKLVKLADEKSAILMVGHMLLYQPAIQFIKHFIDEGKLGNVYSLRQVRRNLGTVRQHENALYSLGVHDLAVFAYLVDAEADKIISTGQSALQSGIEDDVDVHIRYKNGVHAHLHVSWQWPYKDRNLMLIGEKGSLFYDELSHKVIFYKNYAMQGGELITEGEEVVFEGSSQPLKLEMEHFLLSVARRMQPLSDGVNGAAVVGMLEGCIN